MTRCLNDFFCARRRCCCLMARKICKFSLLQFYITSCFTLCQLDYLSRVFIIVARRSKAFSLKSRLHPHQPTTRHIYNFWVSLPAVTLSIAKECVYKMKILKFHATETSFWLWHVHLFGCRPLELIVRKIQFLPQTSFPSAVCELI